MHIQNRAICTGLQGESRDIIPWRTPRLIAGDRDGAELTVHRGLVKVFRASLSWEICGSWLLVQI
jgi:hypothetical protein